MRSAALRPSCCSVGCAATKAPTAMSCSRRRSSPAARVSFPRHHRLEQERHEVGRPGGYSAESCRWRCRHREARQSRPRIGYGLPFGATVWASGYIVLPAAKLYEPIWRYDVKTLANDLSAHLVYGLTTAAAWRMT